MPSGRCGRDERYAINMSVSIRLRSATQPNWRGAKEVEGNHRRMTAINRGIAMIERITKICQRTKSELISLIAASLRENAKLLPKMAATASRILSRTDDWDERNRFCVESLMRARHSFPAS